MAVPGSRLQPNGPAVLLCSGCRSVASLSDGLRLLPAVWLRGPVATPSPAPLTGRGHLDQSQCQELMSRAFCEAIAAAAGCSVTPIVVDRYGVDVTIKHGANTGEWDEASLDVQLKCTTRDVVKKDHVSYRLSRERYGKLITTKVNYPRILAVMVVPKDIDLWLRQGDQHLLMSIEAYWVSLRGKPPVDTAERTVHLPRKQVFGAQPLLDLMGRIKDGETL